MRHLQFCAAFGLLTYQKSNRVPAGSVCQLRDEGRSARVDISCHTRMLRVLACWGSNLVVFLPSRHRPLASSGRPWVTRPGATDQVAQTDWAAPQPEQATVRSVREASSATAAGTAWQTHQAASVRLTEPAQG